MAKTIPQGVILGVGVHALDMEIALNTIEEWVSEKRQGRYVCVTGMHGIMESFRNARIQQAHNRADLVVPDGMSVVWTLRWFGFPQVKRVCGPDLMSNLLERSIDKGYRHFLYGGRDWRKVAVALQHRFPGLEIVGGYSPPFRPLTPEEDEQIVRYILSHQPDIVWVGLSTPKQELWMAEHVERLPGMVLIGVGAAFDFLSGAKRRAPIWMQKAGLEWFFRLLQEPRRLWRRYLLNIPPFIFLVCLQKMGLYRPSPLPSTKEDCR